MRETSHRMIWTNSFSSSGEPRSILGSERGFTLIEIIIVIALLVLIATLAAPKLTSAFKISLDKTARQVASTVRDSYNATALTGLVHRMAYDLGKNEFWVERGPPGFVLHTAESQAKEESLNTWKKKEDIEKEKPKFSLDESIMRKKSSLPRGVKFKDIVTEASEEPITEGIAYTHMFSNGMTEQTLIHLIDDSKHEISLVIAPVMGRTRMYRSNVSAKEAFK